MAQLWTGTVNVPKGFSLRTPWVDVSTYDTITVRCNWQNNQYEADIYLVWTDDTSVTDPTPQNVFGEWLQSDTPPAPSNKIAYWVPHVTPEASHVAVFTSNPLYQAEYWADVRLTATVETP
jgi:hypothetical protein